MKTWKLALCAAAATFVFAGAASAEDKLAVAYNVGAASDYVFRGISQTNKDFEVFGGADASYGKAYAGIWASNVDFSSTGVTNPTTTEVDLYAGYKPTLGPVGLDLGVIYYGYVNKPAGTDEAYVELKAAGSIPVGKATVGASVFYSPDFFAETGVAWYEEINASYPFTDKLSGSAAFGNQGIEHGPDYNTWNAGFTYAVTSHVSLDFRYADTDSHSALFGLGDSKGFATIKAAF